MSELDERDKESYVKYLEDIQDEDTKTVTRTVTEWAEPIHPQLYYILQKAKKLKELLETARATIIDHEKRIRALEASIR